MPNANDKTPKLRMAPASPAARLAQQINRENTRANTARESRLETSLDGFRVGSVNYLNAAPLTRGLESEIVYAPPAVLASQLREGALDAALLSVVEPLMEDRYDILDGIAVASLGEVYSVFLAHREPLERIREIHLDAASLTSAALLRVLLAERGLAPKCSPLTDYADAVNHEAVLLIGNPGIDFRRANHPGFVIWDLGAAWYELTALPFVYAVWALRRGVDNAELRRQLKEAKDFGMDTLDHIIHSRPEYDLDFRRDYLGWHIHYHLGQDEKRGLARFIELLRKHGHPAANDPVFVR